jgi:hypothetical protein
VDMIQCFWEKQSVCILHPYAQIPFWSKYLPLAPIPTCWESSCLKCFGKILSKIPD